MLTSWDDDRTRDRYRWRSDDFTTSTSTSTSTSTLTSNATSTPTNASTWLDTNYYSEQPPSPFAPTTTLVMRNDTRDHSIIPSLSSSSSFQHQHQHPHPTSSMTFTHTTPSIQYPTSTFSNTSASTSTSISSQSPPYPTSTYLPSTSTSTSSQSQSYPSTFLPSTSTSTSTSSQSFPTSSFPSTSTFPSTSISPTTSARDLGQLLDLLSSSTTSTSTSTWSPSTSHTQPQVTSHIQQQQSRQQHLSSTYTSPLPMSHTPSLPSLSPSSSSSTSTSPMPVTDGEPHTKKRRSSTSTSTSTSTSKHSKPAIPDDVPDSLARRLKHRAIDANRRVRLSAGFDALQAMVAPGESHSQIVLLEKSGEMLRSMQAEAATLKTTLRMLKRRRARREKGLSVKEEEDDDEEIQMVKKESMGRNVSDRPSAQFNVAHLNYFCDSNVMLSCTNLDGVLVDVNAALLRAFHLRAPEDRIGKFTLAPHTVKLATSSQPFGQHLAGLHMSYQSHKILHGPNPPIDPSATDPRTLSGLPSSNIVMRDGSVSAQPGLIKGATTNELIPYLPSVVALQKLLLGESESCSIIFEGIDGRGQRYHARFILWLIYNNNHTPQYIMAMCNPNSIIHFPQDSPPYFSTALRSAQGSSISLASSSSSSSNENSPSSHDFHT